MSRGPYAKRFACLDCGEPVGHPKSRCPTCRKDHKSAYNQQYQRLHHAKYRRSRKPIPQDNPTLPPIGTLMHSDDGTEVYCHVCGKGFGSLVRHIRIHGLDAARYKERYGLARGASLLSPATADKQRQRALERDQGRIGREVLAEVGPGVHPKGIALRQQTRAAMSEGSAKRAAVPLADRIWARLQAGEKASDIARSESTSRQYVSLIKKRGAGHKSHPRAYSAGEHALIDDASIPTDEVAQRTGRTISAIRNQRNARGIASQYLHPSRPTVWTAERDAELMSMANLPLAKVAQAMGLTENAVTNRRSQLIRDGRLASRRARWSGEEDQYILDHWGDPVADVARELNRQAASVYVRRHYLRKRGKAPS